MNRVADMEKDQRLSQILLSKPFLIVDRNGRMFLTMVQLLDFWAEWCGPCQIMKPVVEELEKELKGKVEVKAVDVDANPAEASKYGVMSIPTFVILKDGKEIGRRIGVTSKSELLKLVNS